jgi:hypothetical protein
MNDQIDPRVAATIKAMDDAGVAKYGKNWLEVVTIADEVKPKGGVAQAVLTADNPPAALVKETRELLMLASDNGNTNAERILRETRTAEREGWRKSKGIR